MPVIFNDLSFEFLNLNIYFLNIQIQKFRQNNHSQTQNSKLKVKNRIKKKKMADVQERTCRLCLHVFQRVNGRIRHCRDATQRALDWIDDQNIILSRCLKLIVYGRI
jgi:hypothetical protein